MFFPTAWVVSVGVVMARGAGFVAVHFVARLQFRISGVRLRGRCSCREKAIWEWEGAGEGKGETDALFAMDLCLFMYPRLYFHFN